MLGGSLPYAVEPTAVSPSNAGMLPRPGAFGTSAVPKDVMFSMIDKDGDGVISREEWIEAMKPPGSRSSPPAVLSTKASGRPQGPYQVGSPSGPPSSFFGGGSLTPPRSSTPPRSFTPTGRTPTGLRSGSAGGLEPPPEALARQAAWEREVQSLDQKEMELHNEQMRRLREQMSSFARDLCGLQQALGDLQQHRERDAVTLSVVQEEVRREQQDNHQELFHLVQRQAGDHKQDWARSDAQHGLLQDRLREYAEKLAGLRDSHDDQLSLFSSHAQDLEALKQGHGSHASIPDRLAFLETLVGDSIDRAAAQPGFPRQPLDQPRRGMLGGGQRGAAPLSEASLKGRLDEVEAALGLHAERNGSFFEKQAQLESHNATLGERVEFLEQALGDSADKHSKELEAMKDSHSRHANHLQELQGMQSHHASMEERVNYVEKLLGDSADQMGRGEGGAMQRLSDLESAVGDTCLKHGKALDALRSSHDKHAFATSKTARELEALTSRHGEHHGDHATLAERVVFLEQALGDSADRHSQVVADLHSRIEQHHGTLRDMHGQTQDHWAQHHASMGERMDFLEQSLGVACPDEVGDQAKALRASPMSERVEQLEKVLGSSGGSVSAAFGSGGAAGGGGTLQDRMSALEAKVATDGKKMAACSNRMLLLREAWCVDTPRD